MTASDPPPARPAFVSRVDVRPEQLRRLERALAPSLARLTTPALIIDLDAVRDNVDAMVRRCGDADRWRPHIKTLKQAALLRLLHARGVHACKCATLDELQLALATAAGRETPGDVVLAYPLHEAALVGALAIADRFPSARVQFVADNPEHLRALARVATARQRTIEVQLDVDLGMGRTGSSPARWSAAWERAPEGVEITGLHGYDGHLAWDEREAAHAAYQALCELAKRVLATLPDEGPVSERGFEVITSGTHSYHHALAFPRFARLSTSPDGPRVLHRVSPGTIVLSDRRSQHAAADLGLRQAAWVASRVISRDPSAGRITLDAGSKGVAPDCRPSCEIAQHPELIPLPPSEEHLPLTRAADAGAAPTLPELGALLWLAPEHVCTTVNLYRDALLVEGEGARVSPIEAASRSLWIDEVSA